MDLPKSVDDPFLLQHEPLRAHIAMLEALEGDTRSRATDVVSSFVEAMQNDKKVRTRNASLRLKVWTTLP